jgi:hypothetical protein
MSELDQNPTDRSRDVFRHSGKPEWGGAVIAWEREGKRGYQFEDGQLRVFTSAYYHLLAAEDVSIDRVQKLLQLIRRSDPAAPSNVPALVAGAPTLDEQIAYFLRSNPGGFAAERWQREKRGGSGRALKRHRDPVIAMAQQQLTHENLASWLDDQREADGVRTLSNLLARTDLVSSVQVQQLASLLPNRSRVVLTGLRDLLFGEGPAAADFMHWVQALARGTGRAPGWNLATAPLALLRPSEHICVHRTSFLVQAASMAPQLRLAGVPNGAEYARLLAVAERVRVGLSEADAAPADLFDVYDFVLYTVRPEARAEMAARRDMA